MIVKFRIRRDTAANWASVNPVLALGEPGLETDTTRTKYGDGTTAWNSLPYSRGAVAWGQITGTLSAQTDLQAALDAKLDDSQLDTDGTLAANSDARVATQKAVKTYTDSLVAAQDAMVFKGVIDCSTNPNYPAADRGHTYRVSVAGKIGGGSGVNVEVGDLLLCLTDGTSAGTQAAVGSSWSIIQTNLDGVVVGPSSATDGGLAAFDGTTGKLLKAPAAADVRTWLGLVIGTNVQAYNANLAAIAGLPGAANTLFYFTGAGTMTTTSLTAAGRTVIGATGTTGSGTVVPLQTAPTFTTSVSVSSAGLAGYYLTAGSVTGSLLLDTAGSIFFRNDSGGQHYYDSYNGVFSFRNYGSGSATLLRISASEVRPGSDNTLTLGLSGFRFKEIFCANATINTSDERLKCWLGGLTDAHVRAGLRIIDEIGLFQWDDGNRHHVGVRAQQVARILIEEGLEIAQRIDFPLGVYVPEGERPSFRHAFLTFDTWEAVREPVADGDRPKFHERPAGNVFGIRTGELALFLAACEAAERRRMAAVLESLTRD